MGQNHRLNGVHRSTVDDVMDDVQTILTRRGETFVSYDIDNFCDGCLVHELVPHVLASRSQVGQDSESVMFNFSVERVELLCDVLQGKKTANNS